MLLLLLLISSGCDVNIPGCGKRSLPFFKKITPIVAAPQPAPSSPVNPVATVQPVTAPLSSPTKVKEAEKKTLAAKAYAVRELDWSTIVKRTADLYFRLSQKEAANVETNPV